MVAHSGLGGLGCQGIMSYYPATMSYYHANMSYYPDFYSHKFGEKKRKKKCGILNIRRKKKQFSFTRADATEPTRPEKLIIIFVPLLFIK